MEPEVKKTEEETREELVKPVTGYEEATYATEKETADIYAYEMCCCGKRFS